MMSRRDWWLGVVLVVAALLAHAAFPRYQIVSNLRRFDRWTGVVESPQNAQWLK